MDSNASTFVLLASMIYTALNELVPELHWSWKNTYASSYFDRAANHIWEN